MSEGGNQMVNKPQQRDLWVRYLFCELTGAERKRLEREYFSDDDIFLELLAVEDQLIDDFLGNKLTADERQRFIERYLPLSGKRQKVEFAAMTKAYAEENRPSRLSEREPSGKPHWLLSINSFFRSFQLRLWIPILGGLLLVSALTFLANRQKLPEQISTNSEPASAKSQAQFYSPTPAANTNQPGGAISAPPLISVTLSPAIRTRSAEDDRVKTIRKELETEAIELKLKLTGEKYALYQGRLQKLDEGGREILRDNSLKPGIEGDERIVHWKVEAKQLLIGDYQVELQGVKPTGDLGDTSTYGFNVRGK